MPAATVILLRLFDPFPPAAANVGGFVTQLNTDDAVFDGTAHPILVPASGTNFSDWASFQLDATANPDGHTLDNIRVYSDGTDSLGTGVGAVIATAPTYLQATEQAVGDGTELNTTNYPALAAAPVDFFGFTSAAPLAVPGSTSGNGLFGDIIVLQVTVDPTAAGGMTPQEMLRVVYDEHA